MDIQAMDAMQEMAFEIRPQWQALGTLGKHSGLMKEEPEATAGAPVIVQIVGVSPKPDEANPTES